MFKTAYGDRKRVSLEAGEATMTQQQFKKECDINNILKKYQKTGLIEHVQQFNGQYADLSEPCDYQTALNVVIEAQAAFDSLPSSIRKRFSNSPQEFLEFVNDPSNLEEGIKLGIYNAPQDPLPASPAAEPVAPAKPEKVAPAADPLSA